MRSLTFTKRNFLELIRDPLSTIFFVVFPGVLFVVLSLIMNSLGEEVLATVPQFEITHLTMSMIVFSFSFITIFVGNIIANDRNTYFLMRLKTTPMQAKDFIVGYTFAVFPISLMQEIIIILIGLCLGLNLTWEVLLGALILLPSSLLFIGFGIIFGILVNIKAVGGLSSIIPTATSLLGGMFFPLENMQGTFKNICYFFPFANAIKVGNMIANKNFDFLNPLINYLLYTIALYLIAIIIFEYKLNHDNI